MAELSDYQLAQLTHQSECYIHFHPRSSLDQTSVLELQQATPVIVATDGDVLTATNDVVSIDPSSRSVTLVLPPAERSKEYHITMTGTGELIITPDGTDTIVGETSVTLYIQWTSLHLKADNAGNWIIL